ncbi:hypothetical protein HPB47_001308, partial [Ixodes persulcatus]
ITSVTGRFGHDAKELQAVLAPMAETDTLVPAWSKGAETMLASCEVPQDLQGAILLPFLSEEMSAVVAHRAEGWVLPYKELRDVISGELTMTPDECKRAARWRGTLDDLRKLIISDRLKHVMPDYVRAYVLQNGTKEWLRPEEVSELAEKFEECKHGRNWKPQ